MKVTYLLPLLAFVFTPALSHPHDAADDNPFGPILDPRARTVPYACSRSSSIIEAQIAEIKHLQARKIPVPSNLGGYFYAFVAGRKLLGCPSTPLLDAHSKRSTAGSKSAAEYQGDPCDVLQILYDQIIEPIRVFKENGIPVAPYLAGFWTSVLDGVKGLKCDFPVSTSISGNSTSV